MSNPSQLSYVEVVLRLRWGCDNIMEISEIWISVHPHPHLKCLEMDKIKKKNFAPPQVGFKKFQKLQGMNKIWPSLTTGGVKNLFPKNSYYVPKRKK